MSDIQNWKRTEAGNSTASPDGFPEGMPRSGVNNSSREVMAAVKRYYDAPDFRNPFVGFTLTRTTGTNWILVDGGGVTNAAQFLEVGQRIKMIDSSNPSVNFWEGWVLTITAYAAPNSAFSVEWIAAESKDTLGPASATNIGVTVSFKELGKAAWYDVGNASGQLPTADLIKPYALSTNENALNVGLLEGLTAAQIQVAASRGRMNANGGLSVWQRAVSFTNATTAFLNNADAAIADNWTLLSNVNDTVNVTRSSDVPVSVGAPYSMELTVTATGTGAGNKHAVISFGEFDDTADVAKAGTSNVASVSFWVKRGTLSGVSTIKVYLLNLKTLTPTNTPINSWTTNAIGFNAIDWEVIGSPTVVDIGAIGTVWTEVKIQNVTMSSLGVGPMAVCFVMDQAAPGINASWLITALQINRGGLALPFIPQAYALEEIRCRRYYESTFDHAAGTFPGEAKGISHAIPVRMSDAGAPVAVALWQFRVSKYKAPTIAVYNPRVGGTAQRWTDNAASDITNTATATRTHCQLVSAAGTANTTYYIGAGASANIWGNG